VRLFEHLVSLADAWGRADVNAQAGVLSLLNPGKQRFRSRSFFNQSAHCRL
jgi:hypothetical protein